MNRLWMAVSLVMVVGCAGASGRPAGSPPKRDSEPGTLMTQSGDSSEPQLPSCEDGSCIRCGDGICPKGFYCESNGKNTGCAWSPACAQNPTCGCLAREIAKDPRCSCQEQSGGAVVRCRD